MIAILNMLQCVIVANAMATFSAQHDLQKDVKLLWSIEKEQTSLLLDYECVCQSMHLMTYAF